MCYVPPESVRTRTWKPVDVLIGDYSPAFKIHFYAISVVLIITLVNCFYGFAKIIVTKDKRRLKALIFQALLTVLFLGLCIFACFTAFSGRRNYGVCCFGNTYEFVFVVFGLTSGVYAGSFLVGKKKTLAVLLPSIVASAVTIVMYIGEMVLLSGHLYRLERDFCLRNFRELYLLLWIFWLL